MNKKILMTATTVFLAFLMLSSAFFVFSNTAAVKAQTTSVPADLLQYEWPMQAANPARSFSSAGPAPNTYNILWKTTVPGFGAYGTPAPVAFNGMLFVQTTQRTYALDPFTGNVLWNVAGTGNLVKLDNTYMMRGTTCVKISDGSTVWTAPTGFSFAYYASDLKMFISPTTGWNIPDLSQPPTLSWNTTGRDYYGSYMGYNQFGLPYVNGTLYTGTNDGFLIAIDARTGKTLWITPSTAQFFYGGTFADGKVIFGGLDNNMYAWDAKTGQLVWTYNPGTWYGQWASGACSANGLVFEHNQDTYLYAINATTGQLVWRAKGSGIGYSGFCEVGGGIVFSAMGEAQYRDPDTGEFGVSEFNAYDATTGKLLWSAPVETGAGPTTHECIAYGNLYILPSAGSGETPGLWQYGGGGALNQVWCISSQVKDWPMFLGSADNSGEGAGPSGNLALKWKFKADGPMVSSATVVSGVAYFVSNAGTMYGVDANTGAKKWSYSIGFPIKSTPAVANGKVFTGADDGNVYAIDSSTGTKVWQTSVGGINVSTLRGATGLNYLADSRCSPRIFNNVLYVGALDGNLYALDPNSGSVLWKYPTGGPIIAAPAVTSDAIYVPACTPGTNGTFYKLNLNGQLIWKNSVPYVLNATANSGYFFVAAPTVAPDLGMVFLRNGFRRTYGINATTGDILWSYDGRYNIGTLTTGGNQQGGVLQVNSPLYKYGRIYMNDYYGIVCLNATSGNQTWYSFLSRENLAQGLAYSYSRVYSVNELGVVYVLDADTGQKVSYYEVGNSQLHSTPSLYNNSLYIGSFNWYMYCLGDAKIMYAQDATAPSASPAPTPTPAPTADEVAQKVLAALPAYPSIPSADEVAQKVVATLPSGVSADEVAQKVLASLPANPNADQIAQAINNQLSTKPVSVPAEYITATIVLIVGVMVAIAIGVVNLFLVRKRK